MQILEALGRKDDITSYMAPAREALFSPESRWSQNAPNAIAPVSLYSLRTLGKNVDIIPYIPASLDPCISRPCARPS